MKGLRSRRRERLLELDDVERRFRPFGRRYLGVREIQLDALVGTDGRAGAFTRDFRPLHAFSRGRLRSLESAFADGAFPSIVTVKLGEAYFVIEGHHRAALARAEMIDADVTELVARVPLPAGADMLEVVLRSSSGSFSRTAGWPRRVPACVSRSAGPRTTSSSSRTSRCTPPPDAGSRAGAPGPRLPGRAGRRPLPRPPPAPRNAFPRIGCPHLAQTVVSVIGDAGRGRMPGLRRRFRAGASAEGRLLGRDPPSAWDVAVRRDRSGRGS